VQRAGPNVAKIHSPNGERGKKKSKGKLYYLRNQWTKLAENLGTQWDGLSAAQVYLFWLRIEGVEYFSHHFFIIFFFTSRVKTIF
jgi:hypothetical protein